MGHVVYSGLLLGIMAVLGGLVCIAVARDAMRYNCSTLFGRVTTVVILALVWVAFVLWMLLEKGWVN